MLDHSFTTAHPEAGYAPSDLFTRDGSIEHDGSIGMATGSSGLPTDVSDSGFVPSPALFEVEPKRRSKPRAKKEQRRRGSHGSRAS